VGIKRSRTGIELVKVAVSTALSNVYVDLTQYPVELAFMVEGSRPVDADYRAGTWQTIGNRPYACIVVGPGTSFQFAATDESYIPWVRVDLPGVEKPEARGGPDQTIEVY
jgi:hypothetical protein